jgi:hypothetical protein
MRLDTCMLVALDGSDRQIGLVNAKRSFCFGELDIGLPKRLIAPSADVGTQDVEAFAEPRPVGPLRFSAVFAGVRTSALQITCRFFGETFRPLP